MMIRTTLLLILLSAATGLVGCGSPDSDGARTSTSASEVPPDSIKQRVEREIEALNQMRESLAATIDTPAVDEAAFKRVCKPVGQRAKTMARANGWTVQQLAKKSRNPAHEPDAEARLLHEQFSQNPGQTDTWIWTVRDETPGWRYARRITVRASCTGCHGPKEKRPDFVTKGYPDDRAYGFEPGDLRGIYAVFVPDSSAQETRP